MWIPIIVTAVIVWVLLCAAAFALVKVSSGSRNDWSDSLAGEHEFDQETK